MELLVFQTISNQPWWKAGHALARAVDSGSAVDTLAGRALELAKTLAAHEHPDFATAVLASLLETELPTADGTVPTGFANLLGRDIATLAALATRDFTPELEKRGVSDIPLRMLTSDTRPWLAEWRDVLAQGSAELYAAFLSHLRTKGSGVSAVYPAVHWRNGALQAITNPDLPDLTSLHGVDEQLRTLQQNTEALLNGKRAHNVLLYGPRGSGKSTALRGLGCEYQEAGLRLVEVTTDDLAELDELRIQLARKPLKYIVFVDDLAFDDGDARYRPLKSMLEGGLQQHPENVVVYATSNRRHIIKESIHNRPDPLDDDLHRFDAEHEQLALADRFGLTITFPGATQRRYVEIVEALAAKAGITGEALGERAIRFADWHNGYSGRTARQFVDELLKER